MLQTLAPTLCLGVQASNATNPSKLPALGLGLEISFKAAIKPGVRLASKSLA
jgi:hypothetical protein